MFVDDIFTLNDVPDTYKLLDVIVSICKELVVIFDNNTFPQLIE
jgi:hypothetical protein